MARDSLARRLELALVRWLFRLPHRVQILLSGGRQVTIQGQRLHPEMQLLLAARRLRGGHPLRADDPAVARMRLRSEMTYYTDSSVPAVGTRDLEVPGADGPLRARHYTPSGDSSPRPLLVFFHGGGFVVGDLDTHDEPCRLLCHHADVHVLSVEYRLAPEHPFPAAVDDTLTAFRWARDNAASLGADPARVGVGGDSAGGNLAAVVSQVTASEDGGPAFQLLIYPVADRGNVHPSRELFAEGFFLTRADMDWFDPLYVPPDVENAVDPRLAPLRATSLSGLCPAIVITAGFDPLRDEGEAYARALEAAGVRTTFRRFDGFIHGFLNMSNVSPAALAAVVQIGSELEKLAHGRGSVRIAS